jgi:hypothetical protein
MIRCRNPPHYPKGDTVILRLLAALPFLGILIGAMFTNQVTPLVFGMPLVLAWQVLWVVLTAVVMGIIYLCDPANRDSAHMAQMEQTTGTTERDHGHE